MMPHADGRTARAVSRGSAAAVVSLTPKIRLIAVQRSWQGSAAEKPRKRRFTGGVAVHWRTPWAGTPVEGLIPLRSQNAQQNERLAMMPAVKVNEAASMTRAGLAILAAMAAVALTLPGANAALLGPDARLHGAVSLRQVQEVHGCHYTCECGPLKDFGCDQVYHRHLHMLCLPVRCGGDTKCEQTPPQGLCRHVAPQ